MLTVRTSDCRYGKAAPAKFDERSGNVYENKEFGKEVVGWRKTSLLNVRGAPLVRPVRSGHRKPHAWWPAPACFSTSDPGMSMKTKNDCKKLLRSHLALTFRSAPPEARSQTADLKLSAPRATNGPVLTNLDI